MKSTEAVEYLLRLRGVEYPCAKCGGMGVAVYPTTATWHTGTGEPMLTSDVCHVCWGSGDKTNHWPPHPDTPKTNLVPWRKFATRPYAVRAVQWFGLDDLKTIVLPQSLRVGTCYTCGQLWDKHGYLLEEGAGCMVCPGTWIVESSEGRYHACSPAVFEAGYKSLDESEKL